MSMTLRNHRFGLFALTLIAVVILGVSASDGRFVRNARAAAVAGPGGAPVVQLQAGPRAGGTADLTLTSFAYDGNPGLGGTLLVDLYVFNNGPDAATNAVVQVVFGAGTSYNTHNAFAGVYDSGTGKWTADVPASSTVTLRLTVNVSALGPLYIWAEIADDEDTDPDSTPGNCPAPPAAVTEDDCTQAIFVGSDATKVDLDLDQLTPAFVPVAGNFYNFGIRVYNAGPATATGVTVQLTIPAGIAFDSITGSGVYDSNTGLLTLNNIPNEGISTTWLSFKIGTGPFGSLVAEVATTVETDIDSIPGNGAPAEDDRDVAMPASQAAVPGALKVAGVPEGRFQSNWTLDTSHMDRSRAKLENPANFGPGGTYPRPVQHYLAPQTVGAITLAVLQQFDIFIVGYYNDSSAAAFTAAELEAFRQWVSQGGRMLISCDSSTYDTVCREFGNPIGGSSSTTSTVSAAGMLHPIYAAGSPFSGGVAIPTFNLSGSVSYFRQDEAQGAIVLGHQTGNPARATMIQRKDVGCGLAVLFADIDIIADTLSAGANVTTNNDKAWANMIAWMAEAPARAGCQRVDLVAGATGSIWYGAPLVMMDLDAELPAQVTAVFEWDNDNQLFDFWFRGFPDSFQTLVNGLVPGGHFFFQSTGGVQVTMDGGTYVPPAAAPFNTLNGARGQLWTGAPKFLTENPGVGQLPAEVTAIFEWDDDNQVFDFWFRGFPDAFHTLRAGITGNRFFFFQSNTSGVPVPQ